jgi:hypothetical protein
VHEKPNHTKNNQPQHKKKSRIYTQIIAENYLFNNVIIFVRFVRYIIK